MYQSQIEDMLIHLMWIECANEPLDQDCRDYFHMKQSQNSKIDSIRHAVDVSN